MASDVFYRQITANEVNVSPELRAKLLDLMIESFLGWNYSSAGEEEIAKQKEKLSQSYQAMAKKRLDALLHTNSIFVAERNNQVIGFAGLTNIGSEDKPFFQLAEIAFEKGERFPRRADGKIIVAHKSPMSRVNFMRWLRNYAFERGGYFAFNSGRRHDLFGTGSNARKSVTIVHDSADYRYKTTKRK